VAASIWSQTRSMIDPTLRHATRISSVTALFEVRTACQATCSSKQ
jgi:hypothetical protein